MSRTATVPLTLSTTVRGKRKDDPLITELAGAVLDALLKLAKVAALSPRPKIHPRDIALAAEDALGRAPTPDERALIGVL